MIALIIIAIIVSIVVLAAILHEMQLRKRVRTATVNLKGKHVIVTGGSRGIGKSLAEQLVKHGANITLIATRQPLLDQVKEELEQKGTSSKIQTFAVDLASNYENVERIIQQAESQFGPIHILINCAGSAISRRFEETDAADFNKMLSVNYISAVYTTKAALSSMKTHGGHIAFVSSVAGLVGVYGFSAYSASKFALVGFAQALYMELQPHDISVTVSYPPDTDTPGFAEENKTKPQETRLISESGGLWSPDVVAAKILHDVLAKNFSSTVGFEGWLVRTVCCGMTPYTSISEVLTQVLVLPLFRIIAAFTLFQWKRTVRACHREREAAKKVH